MAPLPGELDRRRGTTNRRRTTTSNTCCNRPPDGSEVPRRGAISPKKRPCRPWPERWRIPPPPRPRTAPPLHLRDSSPRPWFWSTKKGPKGQIRLTITWTTMMTTLWRLTFPPRRSTHRSCARLVPPHLPRPRCPRRCNDRPAGDRRLAAAPPVEPSLQRWHR